MPDTMTTRPIRLPPRRQLVIYEYTVSGKAAFPMDMLRHDEAWPAGNIDAIYIEYMVNLKTFEAERSIKLNSYRPPTVKRWANHKWKVVE